MTWFHDPRPTQLAIASCRVSIGKQGQSGLGLEAQEASVTTYAGALELSIVQTFTEVGPGGTAPNWRPPWMLPSSGGRCC